MWISHGPTSATDGATRRRELIARLYGSAAAGGVAAAVERLIEGRSTRPPAAVRWDERDAWLITYPDQFQHDDQVPLKTLDDAFARHLAPWLNGLHVTPFYPWTSDDGYSVADLFAVDERYGTWSDVEALGRARRLMVDAVINHLSSRGRWFQRFLADDVEYRGFFKTADPGADLSATARPRATPLLTRFEGAGGPRWVWTTFSADQVDLDFANPKVLVRVLEALLEYGDRGAQAIRLDAIAYLWKQEGTTSLHLPQTHIGVQLIRSVLTAVYPQMVLVTETNVPHEENVSYFGAPNAPEAHAVYQFALPPLVLHAFLTADARAIGTWIDGVSAPRDDTTFLNFLASHDGVGLRPVEGLLQAPDVDRLVQTTRACGGQVSMRTMADGASAPYELNATWFSLLSHGRAPDEALAAHLASHAILLALQGIPLLYVHSLFASANDDEAFASSGQPRSLNRRRFRMANLEAELADPSTRTSTCWRRLRALLGWRAATPAFHPSSRQTVLDSDPRVLSIERTAVTGERARVHVNVSGQSVTVTAPSEGGWTSFDQRPIADAVRLEPYGSCWMRCGPTATG